MTERTLPLASAAAALLGPVVWAAHFILIYALESVLCRVADGRWHTIVIVVATLGALATLAVHAGKQSRRLCLAGAEGFLAQVALTLGGLSLLAIILVAGAGLALPACV